MQKFFGRLASWLGVLLVFGLSVIRMMLDLVGYTTAPQDIIVAQDFARGALTWIANLPWWLPWATFLICFSWLVWWSFPHQPPAVRATDVPDGLVEAMRKVHSNFRKMEDALNAGIIPSTIPQWNEWLDYTRSVLLTFEKGGYRVPWLDAETDPVGYVYRNAKFYNRVFPLVQHGHRREAKIAASSLAEQLEVEHPGINGREALEHKGGGELSP